MIYDIGIIGAGVAGCFGALRLVEKHPETKAIIFDLGRKFQKRRRFLEGALGCFPSGDGKLYPENLNHISNLVDGRKVRHISNWIFDYLEGATKTKMKLVKDPMPLAGMQKKLGEAGFAVAANDFYQWKPDSIHQLSKNFAEIFSYADQLNFSFDNEVYKIVKKNKNFVIFTSAGEFNCRQVLLCPGRSGWRWVSQLYQDLGLVIDNNTAQYGIQLELAGQYLKDFNKSHCSLVRGDLEIGPFAWNGTIIPEDHADLVISAFRSNEDRWKSEKVSFSLVKNCTFPNNGYQQAERLGKLVFLLFNDRVSKEKIRLFLRQESQLNMLPEYNWLTDIIHELNNFIPNLINRGSFHVPHIITKPAKIQINDNLETDVPGLFVAGESAGLFGILSAAATGALAIDFMH